MSEDQPYAPLEAASTFSAKPARRSMAVYEKNNKKFIFNLRFDWFLEYRSIGILNFAPHEEQL